MNIMGNEPNNDMMDIDSFMEEIRERLQAYYRDEYKVDIHNVIKNNDSLQHGITILKSGSNLSPNIYLDDEYDAYINGKSMESITSSIIAIRSECADDTDFDAGRLKSYEQVRESLSIRLVSSTMNRLTLKDMPHVDYVDMAVIFAVDIESSDMGKGQVVIRNEHLKMWDKTVDRLYADALSNMIHKAPPLLKDMVSLLGEMMGDRLNEDMDISRQYDGCNMYVLTNQSKNFGAAVMVYPGVLKDVADILDGDYYVIPSSVHELIIIPVGDTEDKWDRSEELSEMVREINDAQLSPEEVLSDHVYRYHAASNWLEPAYKSLKNVS